MYEMADQLRNAEATEKMTEQPKCSQVNSSVKEYLAKQPVTKLKNN